MPRTTSVLVGGIIELDEDIPVDPFIEVANAIVTDICTDVEFGYDDARLELIERWLSAHFYSVRDPRTAVEQASTLRQHYENKVDLGLNLTRYGQQAMIVDTAGGLAALQNSLQEVITPLPANKKPINLTYLGGDQSDY